jgi:hypothetical protein
VPMYRPFVMEHCREYRRIFRRNWATMQESITVREFLH